MLPASFFLPLGAHRAPDDVAAAAGRLRGPRRAAAVRVPARCDDGAARLAAAPVHLSGARSRLPSGRARRAVRVPGDAVQLARQPKGSDLQGACKIQ